MGTIAKTTSSLPSPWRFQGRLLLNAADGSGVNTDLYDFVARAYDPALGVFTSLDTVRGGAQNPLTLNRFLYALANPLSMVDPDGHWGIDLLGGIAQAVSNVGDFVVGAVEGVVDAGAAAVTGVVELGKAAFGAVSSATACAMNPGCRNATMAAAGRAVTAFVRDPAGSVRRAVDSAGNALGAVADGLVNAGRGALDRVSHAWDTGNFRELGRMTGRVVGEVALSLVPVGALAKAGTVGRLLSGAARVGTGGSRIARPVAAVAGRAGPALNKALTASRTVVGAAKSRLNTAFRRGLKCADSFSATTLVATAAGAVAIASLGIGDQVLAYDEATGQTASYPVSAVHVNADPVTGTLVIAGEEIETTPEHPFYTLEAGWLDAQELEAGMHVPSASGEPGVVEAVDFSGGPAIMYNLTVEVAHTFFVGDGEWLVHNSACPNLTQTRLAKPGEDLFVGSYASSTRANVRTGLNRTHTAHHAPQDAISGLSRGRGITINIRKDLHTRTASFSRPARPLATRRRHLAADAWELRGLLRGARYERATRNRALLELIRQNKQVWSGHTM
jgi:RHS repeat-associated protein